MPAKSTYSLGYHRRALSPITGEALPCSPYRLRGGIPASKGMGSIMVLLGRIFWVCERLIMGYLGEEPKMGQREASR